MIKFEESKTSYHGQKQRIAVVVCGVSRETLTLADTARCAVDLGAAQRLLAALGERLGVNLGGSEHELQQHCRVLTKWQERKPRY